MPIYDYACSACGHRFETSHGVHDSGPATCPSCGSGPVKKAFAAPAVLFKGSGWAKVDRRSTSAAGKATGKDDAAPSAGTETKPAAGSDSTSSSSSTSAPTTASSASTD